ncbi:DUF4214 domain-containing protein [Acidovorax sp. JG5]|uniref:DUF4214 domain-containing protein n=1 Tax=Acidovorax sp. JG5 TaxID=2822718 RepID=UPI001B3426B4|nr:DUF4214 domain-containing protein [Acidovorax sp. JG5]MBP3979785.1 DUF4214 domain-containing protein [Acidovorax sp. JG5]
MASQDFLNKAYLAYFGRPVDPVGAYAFKDSTEVEVYEAFFASPESQRLYGTDFGAEQINRIYNMLFGRDAEQEGIDYWLHQIELGYLTPAGAALGIMNGALNADKVAVANKLAASAMFTASLDTQEEAGAYVGDAAAQHAREFLQSVGTLPKTQAQIDAAINQLVEINEPGVIGKPNVFTLTENVLVTEAVLANFEPTVKNVTYIGFNPHAHGETGVDNLDGNNPDGNDNNLTNETITDGGVPLYDVYEGNVLLQKGFFSYIADITGLNFVELGLINVGDEVGTLTDALNGVVDIGDITGDGNTTTVTVTAADGTVHTAEVDISNAYFKLLTNLVFDEESNLRLFEKQILSYPQITITKDANGNDLAEPYQVNVYKYVSEAGTTTIVPIVLTKYNNNGGTVEKGVNGMPYVTTTDDDLIVAGRLELLHQAYIDAGEGVNTLEVDAKGYYAQPKALTNIQHVIVNNLPNVYSDSEGESTYPDLSGSDSYKNSVLDLSRAVDIETLTITESHFDGLGTNQTTPGSLTVSGIRNGAETTIDGSFTQNVVLHFGALQGSGVDLVLNNVNFGAGAQLVVAHNSPTLNINSTGGGNYIADGNLGELNDGDGALTTLNISGNAHLFIEGDLDESFHDATPVTINAAANTGGVNLNLSGSQNVTFIGSQANDRFSVQTSESDANPSNDETVTIQGGVGNNYYEVIGADKVSITNADGNNNYEITRDGGTSTDLVTITAGNGANHFEIDRVSTAVLTVGNGNNQFDITSVNGYSYLVGDSVGSKSSVTIVAGNGANDMDISADTDIGTVKVTAGNGGNAINIEAATINVTSGTGADDIRVEGRDITVDAGGSGNTITVVGTDDDYTDGNGALIKINAGTNSVVNLGSGEDPQSDAYDDFPGTGELVAKVGSSITGTNLTLVVDTVADLRAATLSGITKIVLDDDNDTYADYEQADGAAGDKALLTLTDKQVTALVAAGATVEVDGGIFNTSAHIKIIVTQNLDVTTGAWATWLSSLPASVDLKFEINDGATLKLTAQQLHTKVASGGITIADDGNTDQVSGKVYITNAGLDFDPFNSSDQVRTVIDSREYTGGSLSADFVKDLNNDGSVLDEIASGDGVQRNEWGYNVLVDRVTYGYNRPADAPSYSRLTIDTDVQGGQIGPFSTIETFLRIVGESDFEFTPMKGGIDEWGAPIKGGSSIALGVDNGEPTNAFMVDFSDAGGSISNLTLAHFENASAIYGNGTANAPVRVNVEIGGDLDETGSLNDASVASEEAGLVSRDVQTYVVTKIDAENGEAEFWTSRVTEGLKTLGLRGNYEDTITFGNTERGVDFLLEVAYDKFDGYAVGKVVADFARPGATAVVNIKGLSTLPAGETQKVAGIDFTDATAATINVTGGNTVIESLASDDDVDTLVLNADASLTIETELMEGVDSVNAAGVVGTLTMSIDNPAEGFTFVGAAGATHLTIDDAADGAIASIGGAGPISLTIGNEVGTDSVDLSATTLSNVTSVTLSNNSTLTLTMEQADVIGAAHFAVAEGDSANLVLQGLNDQPFALANYDVAGTLGVSVTLAAVPEVHLHPDTDLTGIAGLEVPEGTTLFLTMEQFKQLNDDGTITGAGNVHITDVTQASVGVAGEDLDMDSVDVTGTVTLTLAENVDLSDADIYSSYNSAPRVDAFNIAGHTLTLGDLRDADGVAVVGGANSTLTFTDISGVLTNIDASGFDVDFLRVTNLLVSGNNVDYMFAGLSERVTKVVYNGIGDVEGRLQNVVVEAGTTIFNDISFNEYQLSSEVTHLSMNLQGGVDIDGDLVVSTVEVNVTDDGLVPYYLQELVINSTGTAANRINGNTANVIRGDITPAAYGPAVAVGSRDNNLKTVVINAQQAFELEGQIVFSSHGEDDTGLLDDTPVDGISANDNSAAIVTLTVNGTADVTLGGVLGGVNTQDDDVDGLVVTNAGTGTLSITVDGNDIDQDVVNDNNDALSFLGSNIELTIVNEVNLSDDVLTGVSQITIAEDAALTLTFAQVNAVGAGNILSGATDDTVDEALTIVSYDGSAFDFSALSDELMVNITMASGSITLDPSVNLSGAKSITVPEGGTLNLTAAQFQQLAGKGTITALNTDGIAGNDKITVNITDLKQSDMWVDADGDGLVEAGEGFDLTGVVVGTGGTLTVTTAEDVDFNAYTNLNNGTINIGGFALGLAYESQAHNLKVNGTAGSTVTFMFDIAGPSINAAGYNVDTLRAMAVSVGGTDVEYIIDNLASSVTLNLYEDPEELGYVSAIHRVVVIEEGVEVLGSLVFNGQDDDREVRTLAINFTGDATDRTEAEDVDNNIEGSVIAGSLILDREVNDSNLTASKFQKLTLNSTGVGTSNGITGGITPIAQAVINPDGTANVDNNLLNIEINAAAAFTIGGSVTFNSTEAALNTATLTVNGTAPVTIQSLDVSDADIDVFNVVNNAGTLTVTGASPSINADATESIVFSGTGAITLGMVEADGEDFLDGIDGGGELSSINASGLTGALSIENITNVDTANFSFVSGTGVTTLRVSTSTLNDDDAPTAEPGWSFDLSDAAAGSQLTFGDGLAWTNGDLNVDLGTNAVLYITADTDWTLLDNVNITGTIVLGKGVDLKLTAAQADGLTIIADPAINVNESVAGFVAADVPTVAITKLGDAAYDFSDILAGVQDNIAVGTKLVANATLEDNDVTINAASDLGDISITLKDVANGVASNDDLAGQTIRFNTNAQAERIITVNSTGGDTPSTNVVWLFNSIAAAGGIDTAGYSADITRLWFSEDLLTAEGGLVESLFTTLPSTILRVDFTDLTALNILFNSNAISRTMELVNFATVGNLTFSDVGLSPEEHIENLTIKMGGSASVGNILIDDVIAGSKIDPNSISFNTLTIDSQRALHENNTLAAEAYLNDNDGIAELRDGIDADVLNDDPENVQPANNNTVGNIGVGNTNTDIDLMNVVLQTGAPSVVGNGSLGAGADLTLGTITYDRQAGAAGSSVASLVVTGNNNVTMKSVDTSDADITGFALDVSGFSGTLTVTGGSPAGDFVTDETLTIITGTKAETTINFAGFTAVDDGNESVTVSYLLNGVEGQVVINDPAIDFTNAAALKVAVAAALDDVAGISSQISGGNVVITEEGGNSFVITQITAAGDEGSDGQGAGAMTTGIVTNNGGLSTVLFGTKTDGTGAPYAGVNGSDLSTITVTGNGYVNLGVLAQIDGTDDASADLDNDGDTLDAGEHAFTLNGNGNTYATLGAGNVDGKLVAPSLAVGSSWYIDDTFLTITEDVEFVTGGTLMLNDTELTIVGDVNLTALVDDPATVGVIEGLFFSGNNSIKVGAGQSLTLTVQQVLALQASSVMVFGEGTVYVTGNADNVDGGDLGDSLKTVHIDLSGVTLTAVDGADSVSTDDDILEFELQGALLDDGTTDAKGQVLVGSKNDDEITLSAFDDTVTAGLGDDTIDAARTTGWYTINVDAGTDTLLNAPYSGNVKAGEFDVLNVSAGATVVGNLPTGDVDFVATAATVNNGTATINGSTGINTIDLSKATGANGFTIVGGTADSVGGADAGDVIIGSAKNDVINGGNGTQSDEDQVDTLTGGLGNDTFVFDVVMSQPEVPTVKYTVDAKDYATIMVEADDNDDNDEMLTITYVLNGVASAILIDNDPALDVKNADAVATAIAAALDAVNGITATATDDVVTVSGDNGNSVELVGTAATVGGTHNGLNAALNNTPGGPLVDVPQSTDVTIPASVDVGNVYKMTVTLKEGQVIGVQYKAAIGDDAADIASALALAFNQHPSNSVNVGVPGEQLGTAVLADATLGVITLDDSVAENGGFTVAVAVDPAVVGTSASEYPLDSGSYLTADIITDFLVAGADKIQIEGMAQGESANYDEDAGVADFEAALDAANDAMDGAKVYYLTSITDDEASGGGGGAMGVLFFDANKDGTADGFIKLVGITAANFDAANIASGLV